MIHIIWFEYAAGPGLAAYIGVDVDTGCFRLFLMRLDYELEAVSYQVCG